MTMVTIANTSTMTRHEWLELRKKGIGGSDASVVAGLNKYKSPFMLFLEKTGQVEADEIFETDEDGAFISGSEAAYFGTKDEAAVAAEFSLRTKLKVRRDNRMMAHKDHPWMIANIDRRVVGTNEILECKIASEYLKGEWEGDDLPQEYYIQGMHYLAVTGAEAVWFAVKIGGNKFVYKRIERDEDVIENLIAIEKDFWENHVMTGNAPDIDGSDASTGFLKALYPVGETGAEIELPDEAEPLIEQYHNASEQLDLYKKQKAEAENKLKAFVGEAEIGLAQSHLIEWKTVKARETLDSKALRAEHPDIYTKFVKVGKPTRRFAIKEAK